MREKVFHFSLSLSQIAKPLTVEDEHGAKGAGLEDADVLLNDDGKATEKKEERRRSRLREKNEKTKTEI